MSQVLEKEVQRQIEEYNSNFKWFLLNYKSLKRRFKGKSIAIYNSKIIDSDEKMESLIKRIRSEYKQKEKAILINYIPETEYSLTV